MLYKIYQLRFLTPVHFGNEKAGTSLENVSTICHSDTMFSALCSEYLKLNDELELDDFQDLFEERKILISSLLPYNEEDLFLPKPALLVERKDVSSDESSNKKKLKKLEFIKVTDFENYISCLKTGKVFVQSGSYDFSRYQDNAKVALRTDDDKNKIYHVGTYTFKNDCGLYFIAGFEDETLVDDFEKLLESLGLSGIGGKRSSGYGKFELYDCIELTGNLNDNEQILLDMLENENSEYNMILSLYSPSEKEIDETDFENSFYNLIKRNGFVYSRDYADTLLKRKNLTMFKEGSCFDFEPDGTIQDVSHYGKHPVYRYGKALTIGINL